MIVGARDQQGVALAIVLWMLAMLSVRVAALVSMSRDDMSAANTRLLQAKAFYLGRGVAQLVVQDRKRELRGDSGGATGQGFESPFYSREYEFDGVTVSATVFPAKGFMSSAVGEAEIWAAFLSQQGGIGSGDAQRVAEKIVAYVTVNAGVGGVSQPDTSTFAGYGLAYKDKGQAGAFYVESLLGVEGMTRDLYDRVSGSISPFNEAVSSDARPTTREGRPISGAGLVFEDEAVTAGPSAQYVCVELRFDFNGAEQFSQRIWVDAGGAERGQARLVRTQRPTGIKGEQAG